MSQPEKPQFVTVTVGLRPGFPAAIRICCILGVAIAWASPPAAATFVNCAIRVLTRYFVSIR